MLELLRQLGCFILGIIGIGIVSAAPAWSEPIDFHRDVEPILRRHCWRCHSGTELEGELDLSLRSTAFGHGASAQPVVVPGDAAASLLIGRLRDESLGDIMPLDGDPLSDEDLKTLQHWIAEGAAWTETHGKHARHWAYVAPQRPALPRVDDTTWPIQSLDYYILERLESVGIRPTSPAPRERWLRRVSLALTGLPPSLAELDSFLADERPDACERVVDRLLNSPRYGEYWARHWLDLARYADSNGYQADQLRESWPYRDWVIRAINGNMPFDQFVVEQLAGDLLPNATVDQRIATGFHRTVTCNVEAGVPPEKNRIDQIFDRVNTTGTVFLGTTLECSQCHDHKYDPFSQREYYQLFAYFNNTPMEVALHSGVQFDFSGPHMDVPLSKRRKAKRQRLQTDLAQAKEQMDILRAARLAEFDAWRISIASAGTPQSPESKPPHESLASSDAQPAPLQPVMLAKLSDSLREIASAACPSPEQRAELEEFYLANHPDLQQPRENIRYLQQAIDDLTPAKTLVMVEMSTPRKTHVLSRGDYQQPAARVHPGTPSVLHSLNTNLPPDRLGFATWLVAPANPLLARVTVNRWWAEFFGRGIVTTIEDFGAQSEPPTHPELLDWLADEFVAEGWSLKSLHRLIMNSTAYRQSSQRTEAADAIDYD
ncbi:MAG: PSD1 domain-containing protein, partial [Planctomycetales bacterium]|nr:PSD1 domain-containing protein [Planctomycetales bacterium]